jgi:hypothetical protein
MSPSKMRAEEGKAGPGQPVARSTTHPDRTHRPPTTDYPGFPTGDLPKHQTPANRPEEVQCETKGLARGAWTGVVMIRMPTAVKTASNAAVYLASRSLIRNFRAVSPLAEVHKDVPGLLYRPCSGGVGGDASQVNAAIVVLDDEQHSVESDSSGSTDASHLRSSAATSERGFRACDLGKRKPGTERNKIVTTCRRSSRQIPRN